MANKSIEERAEKSWLNDYGKGYSSDYCNGYIKGATEQRDIDIKAAEDWFCFHECKHTGCVDDKTCGILEGLRNAMKGGNNGNKIS